MALINNYFDTYIDTYIDKYYDELSIIFSKVLNSKNSDVNKDKIKKLLFTIYLLNSS